MSRPFPLDRKEAELLVDLLEDKVRAEYDIRSVGDELLLALKIEFGMIKKPSESPSRLLRL